MLTVAIFPGRFQPPHLGHILTLMRIYPLYDKIIVTVSEYTYGGSRKQVILAKKSKQILERVFKHLPKIHIILIGKGFIERKSFDDLPKFDVVVTGNHTIIRNMEKNGIKTRYIARSNPIPGLSGHKQREAFWYNELNS